MTFFKNHRDQWYEDNVCSCARTFSFLPKFITTALRLKMSHVDFWSQKWINTVKFWKPGVCYNNTHIDIFISVGCYSSQHWHRLYFFFGTDLVKNTGNFYIWYLKNMIPNIFFYKFYTKVVSVYYPKVIDSSLSCFIWLSTCLNRLSAAFELCFTCLQPRTSSRGRLCAELVQWLK